MHVNKPRKQSGEMPLRFFRLHRNLVDLPSVDPNVHIPVTYPSIVFQKTGIGGVVEFVENVVVFSIDVFISLRNLAVTTRMPRVMSEVRYVRNCLSFKDSRLLRRMPIDTRTLPEFFLGYSRMCLWIYRQAQTNNTPSPYLPR